MGSVKPFIITIVGAESSGKTSLTILLAEYFECDYVPEYSREYLASIGRPYNEADLNVIANHEIERINNVVSREPSDVSNIVTGDPSTVNITVSREPSSEGRNTQLESSQGGVELLGFIKSKIENRMLRPASTHPNATAQQPSKIVIVDGGMMTLRMWARIKYKKEIHIVEEALKNDVTDLYILCRPRKEWEPDPLREAPDILTRVWIYNLYLTELMSIKKDFEIVKVDNLIVA